ncbi:unnamed protein product [Pedinophyceae sp. YPF-701]|nr:unnamed protein product [Pedinophyceae sp. YPF-701]
MYVYLSKKIGIPGGVRPRCIGWNSVDGYIAFGGDGGLLKVLKFDSPSYAGGGGNLDTNQTLGPGEQGHQKPVQVVRWNDRYCRLTSADEEGLIIVWMAAGDGWQEEMINNRNKSTVKDMRWTPDGLRICIAYADGAVIVGSVDGQRLWGKDIGLPLSKVEWSPDARYILFATESAECHLYDSHGNAVSRLKLPCAESRRNAKIAGIEWYPGTRGYAEPDCPVLLVATQHGDVQLMRGHQDDEEPFVFSVGMEISMVKWAPDGRTFVAAGSVSLPDPQQPSVMRKAIFLQFFTYRGVHLRSLRVPGETLTGLDWEGQGLRLALTVDESIFLANVRPSYQWAWLDGTVVCAFGKADRSETCLLFWNTRTPSHEQHIKYVKRLQAVRGHGQFAVLASRGEEGTKLPDNRTLDSFILILCNAIGSPIDTRNIQLEPEHMCMTETHVCVAHGSCVYVWAHQRRSGKLGAPMQSAVLGSKTEFIWSVDNAGADPAAADVASFVPPVALSNDPISAITASPKLLAVARQSGLCLVYLLASMELQCTIQLPQTPHQIQFNCDASRIACVDANGILTAWDVSAALGDAGKAAGPLATQAPTSLGLERRDVWDLKWAEDDPELLAVMEKAKLVVIRGNEAEEPAPSTSHLCAFRQLKVTGINLDALQVDPENPDVGVVSVTEASALQELRRLLGEGTRDEVMDFIGRNSHAELWRILAENALLKLDLQMADRAFVRCKDYWGIQLVKRLRALGDAEKQRAEVALFFQRPQDAERIYFQAGRSDLAVEMRQHLGDWFAVEKMVSAGYGDDTLLAKAKNQLGEYYFDRSRWADAAKLYAQAKNSERLAETFFLTDNFVGLEKLADALPDSDATLADIGRMFLSVGRVGPAVACFLRADRPQDALQAAILLNAWDMVSDIAAEHNLMQAHNELQKRAQELRAKGELGDAIELYRRAKMHMEAAKLLVGSCRDAQARGEHPLRLKKLHVLAALEVESFKRRVINQEAHTLSAIGAGTASRVGGPTGLAGRGGATQQRLTRLGQHGTMLSATAAQQTMAGLMQMEVAGMDLAEVNNAWHGAQAYHFWLMAHRELYLGNYREAIFPAAVLPQYEDVLGGHQVASLLALTGLYSSCYGRCSRALTQLELSEALSESDREACRDLAFAVFTVNPPRDPPRSNLEALATANVRKDVCVVTGQLIADRPVVLCHCCGHSMLAARVFSHQTGWVRQACPLCHAPMNKNVEPDAPAQNGGRR